MSTTDRDADMRVRLKLDRLRALVAESNLSQNHWAMKLALSRGHWSDIVNGKHPYPSAKTRERMLEAFRVPLEELFEIEQGPPGLLDHHVRSAISDRYLFDRQVGQGGMGTVYLARDVKLGRQVAVKIVSAEAVSGIGVQQFIKEIRYTSRLQHHHILPLYDAGEVDGHPFYVMPYMRDGSLREALERKGRLALAETLQIAKGVGAALSYAHENRVLHCDVKPANVLLSGDHAFVADFGISRAIHTEAFEWGKPVHLDSSAGTPAYVSPEQAAGERQLDPRSDVYSLACMVYEMLAGTPPFVGTSTMAIVARRFEGSPPDLRTVVPEIPQRVADAVRRGMALPSERRPETADAFVHALERGATHQRSRARERIGLFISRAAAAGRRALRRPAVSRQRATLPNRLFNGVSLMLGSLKQDITYALRTFVRAPVFAAAVVLTLGFGIGANSLVFSLLNPYFLRPLPFADADRLVQLGHVDLDRGWDGFRFSLPQLWDYRERSRAFEQLSAYYYGSQNLTGAGAPERIMVGFLTADLMSMLGVAPEIGRSFLAEEGRAGTADVVMLDRGLWQRRFGGDPAIVNQSVMINGVSRTVIGVMPRRFVFPFGGIDAWIPIVEDPTQAERTGMGSLIVGRLRPDWTVERARAELTAIHSQFSESYPDADGLFEGISVKPIREALNFAWSILRITFALLLAAVGFALVLVCVNVASLTLARSTARRGEVAVRAALGAGRGRLMRQFLTESLLLALSGGILGVILAHAGSRLLGPVIPEDWFRVGEASVDGNVLIFTLAVTLGTAVLFGFAPALAATRTDLSTTLKEGGRGGTGGRALDVRRGLVVFQVAMAVLLMSAMGWATRSLLAAQRIDLGFEPDRVLTVLVSPPSAAYPEIGDVRAYYDKAQLAVQGLPGVRGVAMVGYLPLNHETIMEPYAASENAPARVEEWPMGLTNAVSPGYFDAMSIPLVAGRDFTTTDGLGEQPVVIVSESLAKTEWPDGNAVGRLLHLGDIHDPKTASVVGVVGDVAFEGIATTEHPQVYQPLNQLGARRRFLIVATDGIPSALVDPVRRQMLQVDGDLPVSIREMTAVIDENLLPFSISSILLSVLGAAALLLASLGIYGIISYSAAQRRKEIGLRIALGATDARIRQRFVGEGLKLCLIGLAIGLALSVVANNALRAVLLGIGRFDVVTLAGVAVLFVAVAGLASLVPAVRAGRVDPLEALRYE